MYLILGSDLSKAQLSYSPINFHQFDITREAGAELASGNILCLPHGHQDYRYILVFFVASAVGTNWPFGIHSYNTDSDKCLP